MRCSPSASAWARFRANVFSSYGSNEAKSSWPRASCQACWASEAVRASSSTSDCGSLTRLSYSRFSCRIVVPGVAVRIGGQGAGGQFGQPIAQPRIGAPGVDRCRPAASFARPDTRRRPAASWSARPSPGSIRCWTAGRFRWQKHKVARRFFESRSRGASCEDELSFGRGVGGGRL